MSMTLSSPAFANGEPIPIQHTGQGTDGSPPLRWTEPPAETKCLALICDDPDAPGGTWVHWVLCGLPATLRELPENVPAAEHLSNGGKQGRNDFRRTGYGGPMPPPGKAHRYFFKLYALDATIVLPPGFREADLVRAMEGHILAEAQVTGTYQRR